MTDKVQLIKEEILRRKQSWQHSDKQYEHGGKDVCDYLLGFIDSLSEEPKCIYNRTLDERKKFCKYCSATCDVRIEEEPASEDLEEAANQHSKQVFHGLLVEDNITAFKAGAEWQKQKDKQDFIERAEKFFNKELFTRFSGEEHRVASNKCMNLQQFIEQFKNYMQDESEN